MRVRVLSALLVCVVVAAGCSGGRARALKPAVSTTTTVVVRTVSHRAARVAPLTGLSDVWGAAERRCAVTVKIDNTPQAQPHYGIDQADVVYEEVVEGGITRLAAIFNSTAPDRVGPVRSVRRTDQSIVWPLRGIFAYSGGAPYAIASIDTAPVTQLDETRAGSMMFRDYARAAPHNLYAHVDQMYQRCASPAPPHLFAYRASRVAVGGVPASAFSVGFDSGYAVSWTWDPRTERWLRSIFGQPEITASGSRIAVANVVVMFVRYAGGVGVEGAEADLTGYGRAWVFTGGHLIKGAWIRPNKSSPARLLDQHGTPIRLTAGQSWVELPDASYTVAFTP
jgi:hypothetical protein